MAYRIISSDSHVNEPRDLWQHNLSAHLKPIGLKVVECKDGGEGWTFEGGEPVSYGLEIGARDGDISKIRVSGLRFKDVLPGNYDPQEHIKDQDRDGVDASVMYPGQGMKLYKLENKDLRLESFRIYNDWLIEDFARANPKRIIPLAMIPVDDDIEEAVAELKRCLNKGHYGGIISTFPYHRSYADAYYDPLWREAAASGFPLHFHKGLAKKVHEPFGQKPSLSVRVAGSAHRYLSTMEPLGLLLFSGVFHRYPKLKIVSAESEFGWFPFYVQLCDELWERQKHWNTWEWNEKPSTYFRRQVYMTFQYDVVGCSNLKFVGSDNFMWASDYPHSVSSWPNSQFHIDRVMSGAGVSPEERQKLVGGNAGRLYGLA